MDHASDTIVPLLKDLDLGGDNVFDSQGGVGHTVREDGDMAVVVDFDAGSSDLFTLRFRHFRSQGGGKCTENIKVGATATGGGFLDMGIIFESQKLSLKNITSQHQSNRSPTFCQATSFTPAFDIDHTRLAIEETGKLSDEPLFSLTWLEPNISDATAARSSGTRPAITCPDTASLVWPFMLPAPTSTVLQKGTGRHVLDIGFPPVSAGAAEGTHDAMVGIDSLKRRGRSKDTLSVNATDRHNVSSIALYIAGKHVAGDNEGRHQLPSDFHGNVTFTATNLFGQKASCTTLITTFTKSNLWDNRLMDITGRASNDQNIGTSGVTYYSNGTYRIPGPLQQFNASKGDLFQNYLGNSSDIVFHTKVTPQVRISWHPHQVSVVGHVVCCDWRLSLPLLCLCTACGIHLLCHCSSVCVPC